MIAASLLHKLKTPTPSPSELIDILDAASRYWLNGERKLTDDVEIAIRLLHRRNEFNDIVPGAAQIVDAIAREAGLFSYLSDDQPFPSNIAREVYRVPRLTDDIFFHVEQQSVFSKLMAGQNIVLSAPTSFGKTLLVDALIAARDPDLTLIVVPTISLLEERRRTLIKRFPDHQIITQTFQNIEAEKVIILGTQERIIDRNDIEGPDLFVIDEFYKLDLSRNDVRARTLHLLLAKFIDIAKQVYLLGPSIESNPVNPSGRANFKFIKTSYSPVTADIIRVEPQGSDVGTLARVLRQEIAGSSLVYCRSPRSTRNTARGLIQEGFTCDNPLLLRIARWLRKNYHDDWYLADAIENGIGIHHGRMPRAINHLMVELFNRGEIRILLCTSSLIEGVNTAARNVLIFDRHISRFKLDRFTFDNIKGRAGRMFRHFVGKIYLFNEPPDPIYDPLNIPLLQGADILSDEEILQLPDDRLNNNNMERKGRLLGQLDVPSDVLEKFARYGLDDIAQLHAELTDLIESGDRSLFWTGVGTYSQILASMEVVWGRIDFDKHTVRSARQFAFLANKLRLSHTLNQFLDEVVPNDARVDDSIDLAFNFIKGCEYTFAQPFELLERLVCAIKGDEAAADYSTFISNLVCLGLPGRTKSLEEVGVPAPIIYRIASRVDQQDLGQALSDIRMLMEKRSALNHDDIELLSFTI